MARINIPYIQCMNQKLTVVRVDLYVTPLAISSPLPSSESLGTVALPAGRTLFDYTKSTLDQQSISLTKKFTTAVILPS